MNTFLLSFDATTSFAGANPPTLEVLVGGSVVSSVEMQLGADSYDLFIEFTGLSPSSLSFRFSGASGDPGDTITFSAVSINSNPLNVGTDLTSTILAQSQSSTVSAGADLFGRTTPTLDPTDVTGTGGNDTFVDSTNAADSIDGLGGDDRLRGKGGDDDINGGAGNDFIFGEGGADTILGGAGDDFIFGNDGNDVLWGEADNDFLIGDAGDDILNGGAGNDGLLGGIGNDTLFGEDGDDQLIGDDGHDLLFGDDGNDTLVGGAGNDALSGGIGDDQLIGGTGDDILGGADGADEIIAGAGADIASGGIGNDTIFGEGGNDELAGGDGADYISGGDDNDTLHGDAGADVVIGGSGADTIYGGNDADILHGHGLDADTISDILFNNPNVVYSQETGSFYQFVSTATNITTARTDAQNTLLNGVNGHIVNITSSAEDAFIGSLVSGAATWISGNDAGVEGRFIYDFGAEAGFNYFNSPGVGGTAVGAVYENFNTNEPNDFGTGEDFIERRADGLWNDQQGGSRGYVIEWEGGSFSDDNAIDTIDGGAGNDQIYGYGGADILSGGANDDIIFGGDGGDTINGDDGVDVLYGQVGSDTIDGGNGDDILVGAAVGANAITVLTADFDTTLDGFVYADISDPTGTDYARGSRETADGNTANGSAEIILGGINGSDLGPVSGSFTQNITISNNLSNVNISFAVRAFNSGGAPFETGEDTELFITIDGVEVNGGPYAQFADPAGTFDTGYVTYNVNIGDLAAGTYSLGLGGTVTFRTEAGEEITVRYDDLVVTGTELSGDTAGDILYGGAGNDQIYGGLGNDSLYGVSVADSASSSADSGLTVLLSDTFDTDLDGFIYADGGFGGSDPTGVDYARGAHLSTDGDSANGSAEIILGGVDGADIDDISGNFTETFTLLSATANSTLTFSYRVQHTALGGGTDDFDNGEDLQLYVSLDGTELDNGTGNGFYAEFLNPARDFDTGWVTVSFDTGALGTGVHTLSLGGLLTRKTFEPEEIAVRFDDVVITTQDAAVATGTTNTYYGSGGADTLYGSTETDVFVFEATTAFDGVDVIENFDATQADALDLSELLTEYDALTENILDFVQFTNSGANTLVQVDVNGNGNYSSVAQINDLTDLSVVSFENNGNIIV